MAAGAGQRMGRRPKTLLLRDDQPLLLRQITLLHQAGVRHVAVVRGHHGPAIQAVLQQAAPQFAHPVASTLNPNPDAGPGSSLRCGLECLPTKLAGVLVVLGDQPLLELQDFRAMLHAWPQRHPDIHLLVPQHQGQPGHPLVLSPALCQQLQAQPHGAAGLRGWRQAHPQQVQWLMADHARYTTDVDSPESLLELQARTGVVLRWPTERLR